MPTPFDAGSSTTGKGPRLVVIGAETGTGTWICLDGDAGAPGAGVKTWTRVARVASETAAEAQASQQGTDGTAPSDGPAATSVNAESITGSVRSRDPGPA